MSGISNTFLPVSDIFQDVAECTFKLLVRVVVNTYFFFSNGCQDFECNKIGMDESIYVADITLFGGI